MRLVLKVRGIIKMKPVKRKVKSKKFQAKGSTSTKTHSRNSLGMFKDHNEKQAVLESNEGEGRPEGRYLGDVGSWKSIND